MNANPATQTITTPEGYTITYTHIDPAMASRLLNANTNNRTTKRRNLEKIGQDMLLGRWKFNGDSICIDEDGVILDGQHRLLQIEATEVTITALIVSNLPEDVRATIDTNAIRSAADELQMRGYNNAPALSALTSAFIRLRGSGLRDAVDSQAVPYSRKRSASTSEIIATVEKTPLLQTLNSTSSTKQYKGITRTIGAILHYAFSRVEGDHTDADFFFARLRDGSELPIDSPILKLRNILDALQSKKHTTSSASHIAALTIKAWNAFRLGQTPQSLSFRMGGANPERFPEPI